MPKLCLHCCEEVTDRPCLGNVTDRTRRESYCCNPLRAREAYAHISVIYWDPNTAPWDVSSRWPCVYRAVVCPSGLSLGLNLNESVNSVTCIPTATCSELQPLSTGYFVIAQPFVSRWTMLFQSLPERLFACCDLNTST